MNPLCIKQLKRYFVYYGIVLEHQNLFDSMLHDALEVVVD